MHKYSIVIPTLWKSNRTKKLISDLEACKYVDEIIIIDNTLTQPTDIINGKIRTYSFGENVYVNPAWNAGVFLAKNECIALVNDDINFNPIIFELINKDMLIDFGFIGMAEDNYSDKVNIEDGIYVEELTPTSSEWGWGCMIMFYKEYWINIPHDIKIWYGDNCIKEMNPIIKSALRNFKIETEMSTTSDAKEWDEIKKNDQISFARYYSFLGETLKLMNRLKI
jgi:hypothetical protein